MDTPYERYIGQSSGQTNLIAHWKLTDPKQTVASFCVGAYLTILGLIQSRADRTYRAGHARQSGVADRNGVATLAAAEAHCLLEGRHTTGKVVLQPWA